MIGVEVFMLTMLLALMPAQAGRSLSVTAVDATGEAVPAAAVILDVEDQRHGVNRATGTWSTEALVPKTGPSTPLVRGMVVQGWVVAPGYQPTRIELTLKKRKQRETVVLPSMDTRAASVPLPSAQEAEDVRRALRSAAAALQMNDLSMAGDRLDLADRQRVALQGAPYVDATLAVLEMRTLVALSAWNARFETSLTDPSDANLRALRVSRGVTADLALDWRNYARGAGRSANRAVAMCRTASGRSSRCD